MIRASSQRLCAAGHATTVALTAGLPTLLMILQALGPTRTPWRRRHPQVHFHFTPIYAPWLNQVECWFSILSRRALRGASFTSPRQLREAIDRFIQAHNQRAAPFEWRKREVRPVGLKRTYAHLCN